MQSYSLGDTDCHPDDIPARTRDVSGLEALAHKEKYLYQGRASAFQQVEAEKALCAPEEGIADVVSFLLAELRVVKNA